MQTGFDNTDVVSVWRGESAPDLLPNGFACWWRGHQWRHAPGGFSDGLSSPQFIRLDPDVDSRCWAYPAAVMHDGGYHDDLEILRPEGNWEKFTLSKDECDQLFKELMDSMATTEDQRRETIVFYEAVHLFGVEAFNAGRSATGATEV